MLRGRILRASEETLQVSDLAPGKETEAFLDDLDSDFSANMGVEHEAEVGFAIAGETRAFRRYRADLGIELVYWHEAWFEGPFCYQVTGWLAGTPAGGGSHIRAGASRPLNRVTEMRPVGEF